MNTFEQIERDIAYRLVSLATEYVEASVANEEDWDAAVSAVLASALEIASGWKLKEMQDIFLPGEKYERK
jgi:hypothetical protein